MERDKAAHLCRRCDPRVPDRYKSVHAGQHSSEQVNRASSNPPRGPQSARAQQRLLQMLTSANMNSLALSKNKTAFSELCRRLRLLLLLHTHVPTAATVWTIWCRRGVHPAVSHLTKAALDKRVKYFKRFTVISSFSINLGCRLSD